MTVAFLVTLLVVEFLAVAAAPLAVVFPADELSAVAVELLAVAVALFVVALSAVLAVLLVVTVAASAVMTAEYTADAVGFAAVYFAAGMFEMVIVVILRVEQLAALLDSVKGLVGFGDVPQSAVKWMTLFVAAVIVKK